MYKNDMICGNLYLFIKHIFFTEFSKYIGFIQNIKGNKFQLKKKISNLKVLKKSNFKI